MNRTIFIAILFFSLAAFAQEEAKTSEEDKVPKVVAYVGVDKTDADGKTTTLYGFIGKDFGKTGLYVIAPKFGNVQEFTEGLAAVTDNDTGLSGFYGEKKGSYQYVISPMYKDAQPFSENLAAVKDSNNKWGYIDKTSSYKIAAKYKAVGDFHDGLAPVQGDDGNWGYINKKGDYAFGLRFIYAGDFSKGWAHVQESEAVGYGFIDTKGVYQIKPNPAFIVWRGQSFKAGLVCAVSDDSKDLTTTAYFFSQEKKGYTKVELPFQTPFRKGTIDSIVFCNDLSHQAKYYDADGNNFLTVNNIDFAANFSENYAAASPYKPGSIDNTSTKYGYINKKGTFVIDAVFDYAMGFSEGLAAVTVGKKEGFIDNSFKSYTNNYIIAPQFYNAGNFHKVNQKYIKDIPTYGSY